MRATFPLDRADDLDELVERERGCCGSWMELTVAHLDHAVRVEVTTANPEGVPLLAAMVGLD